MLPKMTKTQSSNVLPGIDHASKRLETSTNNTKDKKTKTFRFKRTNTGGGYDPANPFTFWHKGTDKCNEDFELERQSKQIHIRSAISGDRNVTLQDRLSKKPGAQTREGFFRKLRNEIENDFEVSKEQVIRKNFEMFEHKISEKGGEIDFNDLIFKAKRIPVQKFIEYKREIRLSKLKQVDIAANINDMMNLITKAEEELEENKGTGQKCKEEIEQAVKYSKKKLDEERQKKLEAAKLLADNTRRLGEMKNQMAHLDNEIRELRAKNEMMAKNREFLVRISGLDEDLKWTPPDGRRCLESEEVFKGEFENYVLPNLDNDEDLQKAADMFQVMITEARLNLGKAKPEMADYNSLSDLEQRNSLLQELKSPLEFMEKLRAIESENLEIIGTSQTIVEEINQIEKRITQLEFDCKREEKELRHNCDTLEISKANLEKIKKSKLETIDRANQNKLQAEPEQPDHQFSPKAGRKESKDQPRSVVQLIEEIFRENTIDEFRKEYKGAGVLQQLLCIERSLKTFIEFVSDKKLNETELKKLGKMPEKLETNKRRKEELKKQEERKRKEEKQKHMSARLGKKKTRRDMSRNYIEEKHQNTQEDNVDHSLEEYEKYFT